MRPDAQAHQLPLSEQPTVVSRTLHPGQPAVGSDGIDQSCLVFGMKLKWTQFTRAESVERMYLLVGIALKLWTSVDRAVAAAHPKVRLRSKSKGARLSLARIGSYYWLKMTKQLKLTARFVREHLPPPRLRMFKWLMAPQK